MRIALALLATLAARSPAGSAPAPRPPAVTDSLLVGRWDYEWYGLPRGWISLNADQTYCCRHGDQPEPTWHGLWYVERNDTLVLIEWHVGEPEYCPVVHRFSIDARRYPTIRCGISVTLSNPRRDP